MSVNQGDSDPRRAQQLDSDEQMRALFEHAPVGILTVGDDGRILTFNSNALKIFGYAREEFAELSVDTLVPQQMRKNHSQHRAGYMAHPTSRVMGESSNLLGLRKDGTVFPLEISLYPIRTRDGNTVAVAHIADITERKKAEEKFRSLLEAAPDAMVIVNEQGIIQLVNRQTENLFGYSAVDLSGQAVETLLPERFRGNHTGHREQFFRAPKTRGMGQGLELYGARKSGEEFPVEISLSPLETDEGLWVSAAIRDISDRKRAEQELADYAHQLEQKNKELEQFAYIASHDLQEPLRTVSSFVQLLSEEYGHGLDETADKYMQFITNASQRMKQLIKGLLDYSRIGRERESHPIDCNKLVRAVIADLNTAIVEAGAHITVDPLPVVMASDAELRQLFQNLLSNAIKFTKAGRPPVIHIGAERVGDKWCFAVNDNGIGIESEYQEKVFMIFQRLHTQKEYEGTGIGLAHCKKIVDVFGGDIWVESDAEHGSTFHFTLRNAESG